MQVGRYEITGELGRGAMGLVYKALDPTIGRVVALKTMRLDVGGMESAEMLNRFRNEARSAGMLSHPNLVTIFDAGDHDGLFYIAMEYIEGQTLQALLAERHVLAVEQVISIAAQICAGLDYAHSRGVVHRDIKPANIMIAADGTAKIMDFGIAKYGGGITSTGQVLGTPNYMSPEQVKGKLVDGRSDLFSLGVMLYEMLTGEKPFVGQNVTTIIYKIVNETPIPPRELDVTIHPGLSAAVTTALAKAPDERYQTGAALARDLQNYRSFGANEEETLVLNAATLAAAAPAPAPEPPTAPRGLVPKLENTVGLIRKPAPRRARMRSMYLLAAVLLLAFTAIGAVYYARALGKGTLAHDPLVPPALAAPAVPDPRFLAAKLTTGELRIESIPSGAAFKIDGRTAPQWVTPFTFTRLKRGSHTLMLSKPGFVSEIHVAEVLPGERALLAVKLPSSRPTLVLKSKPDGAEIIIDDHATGMLTPAEITVDEGRHTVALRKPGFEDATTPARVREGQRFSFAPALLVRRAVNGNRPKRLFGANGAAAAERGELAVQTQPAGAEVLINGFTLPRRTPLRFPVRAGNYELALRLEGRKPVKKKIAVAKDQVLEVNENLDPQ